MTKRQSLQIDVPKEKIDEMLNKRIKQLERENYRLKNDNSKLRGKVVEGKELIGRARGIITSVQDAGDFLDATEQYF